MAKAVNAVKYLIQTITSENELVIFLGAGSSLEGTQNGSPFPNFNSLIEKVISDLGIEVDDNKWYQFLEVVKLWEKDSEPSIKFSEYLYGKPGLAHIQLAALSMSMFPEIDMSLILTTNFDDLMFKAYAEVSKSAEKRDPKSFTIGYSGKNSVTELTIRTLPKHLKKGRGVILKLFGDLNSESPIFHPEKMPFDQKTENWLSKIFRKPILFIGYSLRDSPILRLFITSQSNSPIFVVSPSPHIPSDIENLSQRSFYPINQTFGEFTGNLVNQLNDSNMGFARKFHSFISKVEPDLKFGTFEDISSRLSICSRVSLMRYQSRSGLEAKPVIRLDTGPQFDSFVSSDKQILAIIGESGVGKSTLLYTFATTKNQNYFTLFYDSHSLQSSKSLGKKISYDLYSNLETLEQTLSTIDKILTVEKKVLVIIIDAINESNSISPINLRYEIEEIAGKLPSSIKIVYSCRKVFWEANLNLYSDVPNQLYYGNRPFLLNLFSVNEAKQAYLRYKEIFDLKTNWNELSVSVMKHIRDPLMLKLISQSYSQSYLPDFAPAIIVFEKYLKSIRLKYKHEPLIDYIDLLIDYRLDRVFEESIQNDYYSYLDIRTNQNLHLLGQQQRISSRFPENPLVLLEDEKIITPIDEKREKFKFVYERFYEYLIGLRLENKIYAANTINNLKNFIIDKIELYANAHYSFYQGLKNAIVNIFISEENKSLRLEILELSNEEDALLREFGKVVLRELIVEYEQDVLEIFNFELSRESKISTVLDLSIYTKEFLNTAIHGIFHAQNDIRIRSCYFLISASKNNENYQFIISKLEEVIENTNQNEVSDGIIYFLAIAFSSIEVDPINGTLEILNTLFSKHPKKISRSLLANSLEKIVLNEGHKFFGEEFTTGGLNYSWEIKSPSVRNHRESISNILKSPTVKSVLDNIEAVTFFSSMTKTPVDNTIFCYQVEYRIVQWVLIRLSSNHFESVVEILDELVHSGNHFNIDFALGVIEFSLINLFRGNEETTRNGYLKLKEWNEHFEKSDENYYMSLTKSDPFSFNFIPIVMLARIESFCFSKDWEPVSCLIEYLNDNSIKRNKIALLAIRWLSIEFPMKMLNTLEPFLNDEKKLDWINRILSETYRNYPRLLESFMSSYKFSTRRRHEIRSPNFDIIPGGVQFNGERLYSELFLKKDSFETIYYWYMKMIETSTLNEFCNLIIDECLIES
ncbi:MAG: SIR2 family protein [Bacteroidota bacterium]